MLVPSATAGAKFTASGLAYLLNPPICQVRNVAGQTFTTAITAALTWDTEDIDNDNMHSPSVNPTRITAVTAGRYQLSGKVGWATNAANIRAADWAINGSQVIGGSTDVVAVGGFSTRMALCVITVFLNVGDYVELQCFQNSGGNLTTATAANEQPVVTVRMVGTA